MVRFDLWSLLQGQMRVSKLKHSYNLLIIVPIGPDALDVVSVVSLFWQTRNANKVLVYSTHVTECINMQTCKLLILTEFLVVLKLFKIVNCHYSC